jgi:hypothetical protein
MNPVPICIGQKIGPCAVCYFPIIAYGIIPTEEDAGMFRMDHDFIWYNLYCDWDTCDWFFRLFHDMEDSPWNLHP